MQRQIKKKTKSSAALNNVINIINNSNKHAQAANSA